MSWKLNSSSKRRIKRQLALLQDNCCWICGVHRSIRTFTLDHIKPRRFGGRNKRNNFKLACYKCNHERGEAVTRLLDPDYYHRKIHRDLETLIISEHVKNLRKNKDKSYR